MLFSTQSRRANRPSRSPLTVEHLEERWCPAKGGPVLTYTIVSVNDPDVVVTGRVIGTYAANSTVTFSGAVTKSLTTDATGNFSFTQPANSLGNTSAIGQDNHGAYTNTLIEAVFSNNPYFVDFTTSQNGSVWTLQGHINNENLLNQSVTFTGFTSINNVTVATDIDGYFSYEFELGEGESGLVTATATDCFGLTGTAQVDIQPV